MVSHWNCTRRLLLCATAGICLAAWIGALAPAAGAADFTVNSTADDDDGSCDPAPGDCTLREAIDDVNAGLGGSIDFDPAVFPRGVPTTIAVGSALPAVVGSGTTIDGSGTGVAIDGAALVGAEDGLVFESGAGNPLAKVTLRSVAVRNFPGYGIYVCGGARPDCGDPLSQTLVSHVVAAGNGGRGIHLIGSENDRATVASSYVGGSGSRGIDVYGEQELSKAVVSDCAVVLNAQQGIRVRSDGDNLAPRLTGNTASRNTSTGIEVSGRDVIRTRLADNTSSGNTGPGIVVSASGRMEKPRITGNHASGNASDGIRVSGGDAFPGGLLAENVATGNTATGILVEEVPHPSKVKLRNNQAVNNGGSGISLAGSRNQLKNNLAVDNQEDGIRLEGTGQGNKVQGNRALGNLDGGIWVTTNSVSRQKKLDIRVA